MSELVERAKAARAELEHCIMELLDSHKKGLKNSQIARELCLKYDFKGRQKNFLTYSLLGGLLKQKKIDRCDDTELYTLSNSR